MQSDKETNTEGQYLLRLNEEIKNNLLYESSTNSDEMGGGLSDCGPTKFNSSEEEDVEGEETNSENSSPLVTKFLKKMRLEKNDDDKDNSGSYEGESLKNIPEEGKQEKETNTTENDLDQNKDDLDEGVSLDDSKKEVESNEKNSNEMTEKVATAEDMTITSKKNDDEGSLTSMETAISPNDSETAANNRTEEVVAKESEKDDVIICSLTETEKRKRSQQQQLGDDDLISLSSESTTGSSVEEMGDSGNKESSKARAIKPMLRPDQLASETIKAQKLENERISRLEKKNSMLNKVLKDNTNKVDKDTDLILDYIKETKTFIRVHTDIVKLLKHHQCEGIRFMYDSCYGGVDSLKKNCGSGCILAHCMGLGKTLQLVALFHTLTSYQELKTNKILVLCPKSTVMNWNDEIFRWLVPLQQKKISVFTFTDTS